MIKCQECKRTYPKELISPAFFDGRYWNWCAECALQIINNLHGYPSNIPFRGKMAQELYEKTVEYNKNRDLKN
jgi:hypothetical protein